MSRTDQTIALMAVSGIVVSEGCRELLQQLEIKEITYEQALSRIKQLHPVNVYPEIIGIRIKQCSDSAYWYRDKVGTIVPFVRDGGNGEWLSREDAGYLNIVKYKDGELVVGV